MLQRNNEFLTALDIKLSHYVSKNDINENRVEKRPKHG